MTITITFSVILYLIWLFTSWAKAQVHKRETRRRIIIYLKSFLAHMEADS